MLTGVVVNDVSNKTIAVVVYSKVWHKRYGKIVRSKKKYLVHDENNEYHVGDNVIITHVAPISAKKRFVVVKVGKV